MIVNCVNKIIKREQSSCKSHGERGGESDSPLTPQSLYHFHFRAPFFTLEGAKCVLVKGLHRAFVTAILAGEEQRNKALQSPLHCPRFIKTINRC